MALIAVSTTLPTGQEIRMENIPLRFLAEAKAELRARAQEAGIPIGPDYPVHVSRVEGALKFMGYSLG